MATPGTQKQKGTQNDTLFKDREPQKPYPIPWHVPIIAHIWEYPPRAPYKLFENSIGS